MKKLLLAVLSICLLVPSAVCLTGCTEEHIHSYAATYTSNNTHHWRVCECGEIKDKVGHEFGSGDETLEPTCTTEGEKHFTCSICQKEITETLPFKHNYVTKYKVDGSGDVVVYEDCRDCSHESDNSTTKVATVVTQATLDAVEPDSEYQFEENGYYILRGAFEEEIKVNAPNVTIFSDQATTKAIKVLESAANTTLAGFNFRGETISVYNNVCIVDCHGVGNSQLATLAIYNPNLDIVVRDCTYENGIYGLNFKFKSKDATGTNIAVSYCDFSNISTHIIILEGENVADPEEFPALTTFAVEHNNFTNWGTNEDGTHSSVFKVSKIKSCDRIDSLTDDVFDNYSVLSSDAKGFVESVFQYENTYTNENEHYIFNIENVWLNGLNA